VNLWEWGQTVTGGRCFFLKAVADVVWKDKNRRVLSSRRVERVEDKGTYKGESGSESVRDRGGSWRVENEDCCRRPGKRISLKK
jgi:hypothetical protein